MSEHSFPINVALVLPRVKVHSCGRPMSFRSRGPSEFLNFFLPAVRLGQVTKNALTEKAWEEAAQRFRSWYMYVRHTWVRAG